MFDEDLFSSLYGGTSTITDTEQETESQVSSSGTSYNPYYSGYEEDDYSIKPNYTSEQNYNTTSYDTEQETQQSQTIIRAMDTPVIKKEEEQVVSLVKTKSKIRLEPRMKIVATMFAIIVCALVFAIIWNFVSISKLNSMIAEKQITVSELQLSINKLQHEYNVVSDEAALKNQLEQPGSGYVPSDESNTFYVELDEMYTEKVVKDLPSNWFNDVCNFFSNLFAA